MNNLDVHNRTMMGAITGQKISGEIYRNMYALHTFTQVPPALNPKFADPKKKAYTAGIAWMMVLPHHRNGQNPEIHIALQQKQVNYGGDKNSEAWTIPMLSLNEDNNFNPGITGATEFAREFDFATNGRFNRRGQDEERHFVLGAQVDRMVQP